MRENRVARSYAETLFALATRHSAIEEFGHALEDVVRLLETVPGFRLFLETPRIDRGAKKRVLRTALEGKVRAVFLSFLLVVLDKRRQRFFPQIASVYSALVDEHLGRRRVEITLAREPSAEATAEIAQRLSAFIGRTVIPQVRVRPQILGGIIVRSEDRIFDGSLRRQLEALRRRMLRAPLRLAAAG